MNATIDVTKFNQAFAELARALKRDMPQVIKTEAGQLAWEVGNKIGPRTQAAGKKGVDADLKRYTYTYRGTTNLSVLQQFSAYPAFTWLYASPPALVGMEDRFDLREESDDDVRRAYRARFGPTGKRWFDLGKRGRQHIKKIAKPVITATQKKSLRDHIVKKIGQSRAAWAYTAARLVPAKRIAKWIRIHFPAVEGRKALYNPSGLSNRDLPIMEFGSRAPGVESNPKIRKKIEGAVVRRTKIMEAKVRKILKGYAYEFETGRVFKPRGHELDDLNELNQLN